MAPPGLMLTPVGWFSWCSGLLKVFQNKLLRALNKVTIVCVVVASKVCAKVHVFLLMCFLFCWQVRSKKKNWESNAGNSVGRGFCMLGKRLVMK